MRRRLETEGLLSSMFSLATIVILYGGILFFGAAIVESNVRDIVETGGGDFWNIFWLFFVVSWFMVPTLIRSQFKPKV